MIRVDANDMGTDLQSVLITKEEIDAKLAELAAKIDAEYAGKDLLIVGVLKGAVMVMADLSRALHRLVDTYPLHERFVVQWIASERAGRSVIPTAFWLFSIGGGVLLFAYSLYRRDPVFIAGQGLGLFIYLRNLYFVLRERGQPAT